MERLVKEAIDFKRNKDSKKSLSVGHNSPKMIQKHLKEAEDDLYILGYTSSTVERTSKFMTGITWEISLQSKTSATQEYGHSNKNIDLYYTAEPEQLLDFISSAEKAKLMTKSTGHWVLIDKDPTFSTPYDVKKAHYTFATSKEMIEKFIQLDLEEAVEDWNWMDITKRRLAILEKIY